MADKPERMPQVNGIEVVPKRLAESMAYALEQTIATIRHGVEPPLGPMEYHLKRYREFTSGESDTALANAFYQDRPDQSSVTA